MTKQQIDRINYWNKVVGLSLRDSIERVLGAAVADAVIAKLRY